MPFTRPLTRHGLPIRNERTYPAQLPRRRGTGIQGTRDLAALQGYLPGGSARLLTWRLCKVTYLAALQGYLPGGSARLLTWRLCKVTYLAALQGYLPGGSARLPTWRLCKVTYLAALQGYLPGGSARLLTWRLCKGYKTATINLLTRRGPIWRRRA